MELLKQRLGRIGWNHCISRIEHEGITPLATVSVGGSLTAPPAPPPFSLAGTHDAQQFSSPQATTRRTATARSRVRLPPEVTSKMESVGGEVVGKKGPVFTTAIIAGVQAAKRTSDLIPFCHPLPVEDCRVELSLVEGGKVRVVAMLLEAWR